MNNDILEKIEKEITYIRLLDIDIDEVETDKFIIN
jgi:hypothetical protein